MAGRGWISCAVVAGGVWLVGCQSPVYQNQPWAPMVSFKARSGGSSKDLRFTGSQEAVAAMLQNNLNQLGVATMAAPDGEELHVSGTTSQGEKLTLVLTRELSGQTEATRVRIVWENGKNNDIQQRLVALGAPPKQS